MNATLVFNRDCRVRGLYTEAIELSSLGRLTMERASSIEFNETIQQWEVRDPAGILLHSNFSRQACLDWEQQHFNERNDDGILDCNAAGTDDPRSTG